MRNYKFYKEDNRWYIDLPEWTGDKAELEMVAGADTMLDILAQGDNIIYLVISDVPFENADVLKLEVICSEEYWQLDSQGFPSSGAFYKVNKLKGVEYDYSIWLCDVTKFIFNEFPDEIFIL